MDYARAICKEYKDLIKSLEDGKISKYEVANLVLDCSALIEAKKANQKSLRAELEYAKDAEKQEIIQSALRKQQHEQSELENLILSLSISEALNNISKKENNIIHFRKK